MCNFTTSNAAMFEIWHFAAHTVHSTDSNNTTGTSIFGDGYYPHMPRASTADRCQSPPLTACAPSVEGIGVYRQYLLSHADSSDFGLLGEQSSPEWETPCPGRRWTTVQNLTPLALSSPEKSVTEQIHTQTKKTNSSQYIHTLPIGMCI